MNSRLHSVNSSAVLSTSACVALPSSCLCIAIPVFPASAINLPAVSSNRGLSAKISISESISADQDRALELGLGDCAARVLLVELQRVLVRVIVIVVFADANQRVVRGYRFYGTLVGVIFLVFLEEG